MKFRLSITLILLSLFVSAVRGQSNCCEIVPGGSTTQGTTTTVPGAQGGSYTSTATQTTSVTCFNTSNSKPCSASNPPNNVVTATGTGQWSTALQRFVACNPSFMSSTDQAASGGATFTNDGTTWGSVDGNGNCVKAPTQPFTISTCPVVTCVAKCFTGCGGSPIIIDVSGHGFDLTSAANGVKFDIAGAGTSIQMGWTAPGADNAFLALPGADGLVHNGQQLFGNFTPQPQSATPNGFAALAMYDLPANGGNGDGVIDAHDAVFASLRLWIDLNHDGVSQPNEMFTLPSLGVNSISLNYKADERTDQWGNVFHYRAQVNPGDATSTGRIAYDVFFVEPNTTTKNINLATPVGGKCQVPDKKVGMLATGTGGNR